MAVAGACAKLPRRYRSRRNTTTRIEGMPVKRISVYEENYVMTRKINLNSSLSRAGFEVTFSHGSVVANQKRP
jgi:hypothetical protein